MNVFFITSEFALQTRLIKNVTPVEHFGTVIQALAYAVAAAAIWWLLRQSELVYMADGRSR